MAPAGVLEEAWTSNAASMCWPRVLGAGVNNARLTRVAPVARFSRGFFMGVDHAEAVLRLRWRGPRGLRALTEADPSDGAPDFRLVPPRGAQVPLPPPVAFRESIYAVCRPGSAEWHPYEVR